MVTANEIKKEHWDTELLRLRQGQDGCGCVLCQEFYKTIDLSVYGDRVKRYGGTVIITSGKTGADLYEEFKDAWVKNDSIFICDGKGYAVTKNGSTVCIGPVDSAGNPIEKAVS